MKAFFASTSRFSPLWSVSDSSAGRAHWGLSRSRSLELRSDGLSLPVEREVAAEEAEPSRIPTGYVDGHGLPGTGGTSRANQREVSDASAASQ